MTGVTRLRAAGVAGFDAVLEPPKAASKLSKFGCHNTKTLIIISKSYINVMFTNTPLPQHAPQAAV